MVLTGFLELNSRVNDLDDIDAAQQLINKILGNQRCISGWTWGTKNVSRIWSLQASFAGAEYRIVKRGAP